jgi:signal transduction histidine kinase
LAGCDGNPQDATVSAELRGSLTTFLLENEKYFGPVFVLQDSSVPLLRGTIAQISSTQPNETASVSFQTKGLPANNVGPDSVGGDIRFRSARDETPLRTLIERGPWGSTVRYTVPIVPGNEDVSRELFPAWGALVVDLKLDQLFKEQAGDVERTLNGVPTGMQTSRVVIILHQSGRVYYHSNAAVNYQPVASSLPDFKTVANAMMAEETGARFYEASDGDRWLASYRPVGQYDLSLAVVTDYSRALAPLRQELLFNFLVSLLLALLAAGALTFIAQRRSGKSLQKLTQGAVAIARGQLDQELVVSSAENQLLADSMNLVTARLREQLAREAESRQFDSFLRLSAMLTHDLKNTITALSLGVSNMERNFDRPEFRADAMSSLKEVTAKLQKLVAKLSEPVSMSGEHQVPRSLDLVPMIQRVVGSLTSASSPQHQLEIQLPEQLIAVVEPDRIEKVFENLVINSLEAMGGTKGKLTIAAGSLGEQQVFFSVADTGPGISKSFQERRLFHPFATTKRTGVGLGLYTCREVVRAHGGSIEVTSKIGVGTTFRVVLPSVQPGE